MPVRHFSKEYGLPPQSAMKHLLFIQQPIQQVQGFDSIVGFDEVPIHGQNDFFVIVRNHLQRPQFPSPGFRGNHTLRYLDIHLIIRLFCYEVYLCFAHLSNIDPIVPAEQFQIDNVFQNMPVVCVPAAWKCTMSIVLDL